ncbi:MAG: hypothetical protein ABJF04_01830 [Reichenbachiella sp.]|uniref:hypothetical protein n=1 Tax=Reichenbachiella sp. TaxID=2184521 RepID=UPI003267F774
MNKNQPLLILAFVCTSLTVLAVQEAKPIQSMPIDSVLLKLETHINLWFDSYGDSVSQQSLEGEIERILSRDEDVLDGESEDAKGNFYWYAGDYYQAKFELDPNREDYDWGKYYLKKMKELSSTKYKAVAYAHLGNLNFWNSTYIHALNDLQQSLYLYRIYMSDNSINSLLESNSTPDSSQLNLILNVVDVHKQLAEVHADLGNFELALNIYKEIDSLYSKVLIDNFSEANNLIIVLSLNKALIQNELFKKSDSNELRLSVTENIRKAESFLFNNSISEENPAYSDYYLVKSSILMDQQENDESSDEINLLLMKYRMGNFDYDAFDLQANYYILKAKSHTQRNEPELSIQHLDSAITAIEKTSYRRDKINAYKDMNAIMTAFSEYQNPEILKRLYELTEEDLSSVFVAQNDILGKLIQSKKDLAAESKDKEILMYITMATGSFLLVIIMIMAIKLRSR